MTVNVTDRKVKPAVKALVGMMVCHSIGVKGVTVSVSGKVLTVTYDDAGKTTTETFRLGLVEILDLEMIENKIVYRAQKQEIERKKERAGVIE